MESKAIKLGVCQNINTKDFHEFYELTKKCLGWGEICEIWKAIDKRTGKTKTVKIFRKSDINEEIKKIVLHELHVLSELDHPNIVKVYEAFEDEFKVYMIIDEIEGESLFTRIIRLG